MEAVEVLRRATEAGVNRLICVGTNEHTSEEAVKFVVDKDNCWASLGLHPHEAINGPVAIEKLRSFVSEPKVVAIGECGLDYFYNHSPRDKQTAMLRAQIELALEHDLPMIFHVREAFDDFWPIFDSYQGIRGVLHSFTDTSENLGKALERNLYIGVNGISTFTKVESQRDMYRAVPLDHLLLETDAPFLTPVPHRGTVNEPAFVTFVAKHLSDLQHISLEELSVATNRNATNLFSI
jgi:TatD DNase family protein